MSFDGVTCPMASDGLLPHTSTSHDHEEIQMRNNSSGTTVTADLFSASAGHQQSLPQVAGVAPAVPAGPSDSDDMLNASATLKHAKHSSTAVLAEGPAVLAEGPAVSISLQPSSFTSPGLPTPSLPKPPPQILTTAMTDEQSMFCTVSDSSPSPVAPSLLTGLGARASKSSSEIGAAPHAPRVSWMSPPAPRVTVKEDLALLGVPQHSSGAFCDHPFDTPEALAVFMEDLQLQVRRLLLTLPRQQGLLVAARVACNMHSVLCTTV
jgi:hypothetical protein